VAGVSLTISGAAITVGCALALIAVVDEAEAEALAFLRDAAKAAYLSTQGDGVSCE
jgi:hypothetical protein